MIQVVSDTAARLARIEAALVQTAGLLRCLEADFAAGNLPRTQGILAQWHSQIEEKREMLQKAALDAIKLQESCRDGL